MRISKRKKDQYKSILSDSLFKQCEESGNWPDWYVSPSIGTPSANSIQVAVDSINKIIGDEGINTIISSEKCKDLDKQIVQELLNP